IVKRFCIPDKLFMTKDGDQLVDDAKCEECGQSFASRRRTEKNPLGEGSSILSLRLENKAGSGGLCFLANLIVLAAVPTADRVTTCRVCSGTSTGVRKGLLAHLQPCAVEGQSGLASLLTTTAAT
ncbi:unnamed protein product, partial [Laminaria digitata]